MDARRMSAPSAYPNNGRMSEKKKSLSEADICHRYITPAIHEAGWAKNQIRMEYQISAGQIVVRGKVSTRKKARRADYVLFYRPNLPIAVVEAKDNRHVVGAGMQQALDYSASLDVPFVFSSNGDAFRFQDRTEARLREVEEISEKLAESGLHHLAA